MTGVLASGNDARSLAGWREGLEELYINSAGSFSLGSFDLGAVSSPERFEWVKMNLDTGAAVNTYPLNFWSRWCRGRKILQTGQW